MHHESESGHIPEKDRRFTRRQVLGAASAVGIGMLSGAAWKHKQEQELPKLPESQWEWNPDISRHLVLIDFAPDVYTPDFVQGVYVSDDEMLKRELGSDYIGIEKRMALGGLYWATNEAGQMVDPLQNLFERVGWSGTIEEQFLKNNPHYSIASYAMDEIGDHGDGVHHVMWHTVNSFKQNETGITPRIYPIQNVMDISFREDLLGNYTLVARADSDKIIEALSHYPEQKIVNFSWQAGEVKIKALKKRFLENCVTEVLAEPQPEIIGAYRPEVAVENLRELFKICDAYQDKVFFAALGNNGDDIREARRELDEVWPSNVMMVGSWNYSAQNGYPNFASYGGDMYVKNLAQSNDGIDYFESGSSMSTGLASSTAAYLMTTGMHALDVIPFYLSHGSEQARYVTARSDSKHLAGSFETTRLYSPQNVKTYLGPRYIQQ